MIFQKYGVQVLALSWVILINLIAFITCGADKKRSRIKGKRRVPEKTLFLLALLGGSLGMWIGMKAFHHKTKHWYFKYGIPAIFFAETALVILAFIFLK